MLNNLGLGLTDKASPSHINHGRSYLDIYEDYFDPIKDKNLNVLEIGINNGGSLKLWKKYFKNSKIFGLDIDPRCKAYAEENVNVHIGSQGDEETISKLVGDAKTFDIIIDDGLHTYKANKTFFENSYTQLSDTGIFIIEDIPNNELNHFRTELATIARELGFDTRLLQLKHNSNKTDNNIMIITKNLNYINTVDSMPAELFI